MANSIYKYLNIWLLYIIFIVIILIETTYSHACPEYKVTWILIEVLMFMIANKFWEDKINNYG